MAFPSTIQTHNAVFLICYFAHRRFVVPSSQLDSALRLSSSEDKSNSLRNSQRSWLTSYTTAIAVITIAVLISLSPAHGFRLHKTIRSSPKQRSAVLLLRSSPISDMEDWLEKNGVNIDLAKHDRFEDGTPNASVRGLRIADGGNIAAPIVNLPRKLTLSSSKDEGWDKDLATQLLREVAKGGRGEFSGYVSLLTNGKYGGSGSEAWGGGEDEAGIPNACNMMPLPEEWAAKDALR